MMVHELMSREVDTIDADAKLQGAARCMRDMDVGSLPVLSEGLLVGMVTDRDLVARGLAEDRNPATTRVRDVMSSTVETCRPEQDVVDVAGRMAKRQLRRIPVVDGHNGALVGMLPLSDLARHADEPLAGQVLAKVVEPSHLSREL